MPNLAIIPLMGADGVSVIDSALVAEIINLCKTCMGLFTEFPLNVILIAGLCGIVAQLSRQKSKIFIMN